MMNEKMKKQWNVRRRMAKTAFIAGIFVFPVAYINYPLLGGIAAPYYGLIMAVLAGYYGFATWHDMKRENSDG